jgi:hypothetical protein
MMSTYDIDLYAWAKAQADALRRRAGNKIDYDNLAEEIEGVGVSNKHEIESRLEVLLIHLLKWRYNPDWRCNSWRSSIREARRRIALVLKSSPSLKTFPGEALVDAYHLALDDENVRGLGAPDACPWSIGQILDTEWLP